MNDGFITALNTQRATANWIDALAQNMANIYTPGYRENQFRFHTFLNGGYVDEFGRKNDQGNFIYEVVAITNKGVGAEGRVL